MACVHTFAMMDASNLESELHALTPQKNSTPSTDEGMNPIPRKMLPKNALTTPSKHGSESLREPRNMSSTREHEPSKKTKA